MLPALSPSGKATLRLLVTAPALPGKLQLIIEVLEESIGSLDPSGAGVLRAEVTIVPTNATL
jgi:hypothetical protein